VATTAAVAAGVAARTCEPVAHYSNDTVYDEM
jgi:hypothetical protein